MTGTLDNTVLIVSALAVFFATMFGTLLVLKPESTPPSIVAELPDVAAGAGEALEDPAQSVESASAQPPVERILEQLGVKCGHGDCSDASDSPVAASP